MAVRWWEGGHMGQWRPPWWVGVVGFLQNIIFLSIPWWPNSPQLQFCPCCGFGLVRQIIPHTAGLPYALTLTSNSSPPPIHIGLRIDTAKRVTKTISEPHFGRQYTNVGTAAISLLSVSAAAQSGTKRHKAAQSGTMRHIASPNDRLHFWLPSHQLLRRWISEKPKKATYWPEETRQVAPLFPRKSPISGFFQTTMTISLSHRTRTTSISIIISSMNIISNTPRSNVDMELFLSVYAHNNWYANKQVYNL